MTLLRLKTAPIVLIEDDVDINIIPLLQELTPSDKIKTLFFCYDQPAFLWKNVFKGQTNITYCEEFDADFYDKYVSDKCSVIIHSVNQMSLSLSWNVCLKTIKKLSANSNVHKLILILHKDCLPPLSKIRTNLNHLASAIVCYSEKSASKISVLIKKGGKVIKSDETLSFDVRTSMLKLTPIVKDVKTEDEPEKPLPANLSTFKIEVDQTDKLEKYKLQLPYMSKIKEGQGKIFYEPDAVDDWDEEDPDEDLDI